MLFVLEVDRANWDEADIAATWTIGGSYGTKEQKEQMEKRRLDYRMTSHCKINGIELAKRRCSHHSPRKRTDFMVSALEAVTENKLYDKMLELYPDRVNPRLAVGSARVLKP